MCSYQEWESITRRFQEAGVEREVREFVADAMTRVEGLVEHLKSRACVSEDGERARECRRQSRAEWV
jgi:hypothetical protein